MAIEREWKGDRKGGEGGQAETNLRSPLEAEVPTVLAGRYRITALLGSGGMGTVYRATDQELDEVVAIKLMGRWLGRSPETERRLVQEVKLARRVTHRNVVRTFDIGVHEGDRFLTMEYVEGVPLSTVFATELPLDPRRACAIAVEICAGLAASHEAKVVHSDLKPANVICANDGRIVLTDFGIARAVANDLATGRRDPTAGGGTTAYMSPEQVESLASIDGRADIYALGCTLFQMVTGVLPWRSASIFSSALLRLTNDPPDPRDLVEGISSSLAETILKCMARSRNERFESAKDVALALTKELGGIASIHGSTPSSRGSAKSLAVLPIQNQGVAADDYLAYGLGEELVDAMSAFPELLVRPLAVSMAHAKRGADSREIGRALEVDAVVEGSLLRSGNTVSLRLRLLSVSNGFQIATWRFEHPTETVLALASGAAASIAEALTLGGRPRVPLGFVDIEAQDLYLRGRYLFVTSYYETTDAIPLLRSAYERAPDDVRIAATYVLALIRHFRLSELDAEVARAARQIALAAVERHPEAPDAHVALGAVHFEEGQYRLAAIAFCRALTLSPRHPDALDWSGRMLLEAGEPEWAINHFTWAKSQDPNNVGLDAGLVRAHFLSGDEDTAWSLARAPTLESEASFHWRLLGRLTIWSRDRAAANRELVRLRSVPRASTMERPEFILRVSAIGRLTPLEIRAILDDLAPSGVARRDAFRTQMAIETFLAASMVEYAWSLLPSLENHFFFDLTWLDRCPALEPVRDTTEFVKLRESTAARAALALEVFERTHILFTGLPNA